MKQMLMTGKGRTAKFVLALLSILLLCCCLFPFVGGRDALKVSAATSDDPCTVQQYTVNATVNADRTIDFDETITFTLHQSFESFYRSLPVEGDRFLNIKAYCEGNDSFSYDVAENPEVDGFMDINCYGGLQRGKTLTYRFTYTMQVLSAASMNDGMIIDFVGAGWPFALNNVTVNVTFPAPVQGLTVYSSSYGESRNDYAQVEQSADKTQLTLTAERLPLTFSQTYVEYVAVPITVEFSLGEGVLIAPMSAQFQGGTMGLVLLCIALAIGVFVVLRIKTMAKPEITPVVGFYAPDGMDPLTAGKLIDGVVDTEDITSMIYYFAAKGYLTIVMEGDDPVLHRQVGAIAANETPAAHTLFQGLFKMGGSVRISDLECRYYASIDHAKQLLDVDETPMYEKKSLGAFLLSLLLAAVALIGAPWLIGVCMVGKGYVTLYTLVMLVPLFFFGVFSYLREGYRYKRKSKRGWMTVGCIAALAVGAILYLCFNSNVLTFLERLLVLLVAYAILLLASGCLTRTADYAEILGKLLGFQEFILVTKEDKIKFLLEQTPTLFYDILPYAQVLGVTNEWEDKFKNIAIQPPSWYYGSTYDYWLLSRGLRRMNRAMVSRPQQTSTGRSGGGGRFGGFSGGGGGGGGGGFR